jgi:hypothetical protein
MLGGNGPSAPTDATVKRLYAQSGNVCAFPGCGVRIVQDGIMVGAICHIRAASPLGPRYEAGQTNAERHGEDNLILLCANHHRLIDGDAKTYSADNLREVKARHQASVARLTEEEVSFGARLLVLVNQSGGIAAQHIETINIHAHTRPAMPRALPVSAGMTFMGLTEVLTHMGAGGHEQYEFDTQHFIYLRLIPQGNTTPMSTPELWEVFKQARILPMSERWSGTAVRNKCGAMYYVEVEPKKITSFTQGFTSGELWGMNSTVFEQVALPAQGNSPARNVTVIPAVLMEKLYVQTLNNYVQVAQKVFERPLPYTVECGIKGVQHAHVEFPRNPSGFNCGPIFEEAFRRVLTLTEATPEAMNALLARYFDEFYSELVGYRRKDVIAPSFVQAHALPSLD